MERLGQRAVSVSRFINVVETNPLYRCLSTASSVVTNHIATFSTFFYLNVSFVISCNVLACVENRNKFHSTGDLRLERKQE